MTRRKELASLLAEGPRSISSLARTLGMRRGDVEADLHHLLRSARAAGAKVVVIPARCRSCGFTFGDDKLSKPGKCPSCRGTRLFEPQLCLEAGPETPP
jgi:predicted Zn-ribbon and HTH transcriptional regulator